MTEEMMQVLIKTANQYYNGQETQMDDESYDKLLKEAKMSDPEFNIFKHVEFDDHNRIVHRTPFVQPDFKIEFHSIQEFIGTLKGDEYITPKYDGSSVRAYYINGRLVDIITRNDEYDGIRQYNKLKTKVPNNVDVSISSIDFESLCTIDDFGIASRSKANGLINSKYKQDEVDKYLTLVPFYVTSSKVIDYIDRMTLAGFVVNKDYLLLDKNCLPDYLNKCVTLNGKQFPIDGFAMYFKDRNNFQLRKHYATERIQTTVTDIQWNISDKYAFIPKVIVDPVYVEGRRISKCTANGYGELLRKKCGVGSTITIVLAKSTIPQVGETLIPSEDYKLDKPCPYCGSKLEVINDRVRCSNIYCSYTFSNIANRVLKLVLPTTGDDKVTWNGAIPDIDTFTKIVEENRSKLNTDIGLGDLVAGSIIIDRFSNGGLNNLKNFINDKTKTIPFQDLRPEPCMSWRQHDIYGHYVMIYHSIFKVIFGDKYNDGIKL